MGHTEATVFVECDGPCQVEVLGRTADTFEIDGHHFAVVCVEDLDPDREHPYQVHLDGRPAWPPPDYEFPQPRIRLIRDDGRLRLLFGSCRASGPHRPPDTHQRWWHKKGKGIDALRTYALRMLRQPSALWPDTVMMVGDQLYADQVPDPIKDIVADRQVHANGPVEVLEDFQEYCLGYQDAWSEPVVRWLLSTVPSAMIFDDHEINDKWNTSQAWLDAMRQTDWYETRIIGGLMAYWIYQHLGNLSPAELAEHKTFRQITETRDGSELVRDLARRAEYQDGHSRFSFCRDLGPARLLMLDSRTSRRLEPGNRRIMSPDEWDWIKSKVDGRYEHLLMASPTPFFLPAGMHFLETWADAVTDSTWGRWGSRLGERARMAANLDHWACFQLSFSELEQLILDVAAGRCGRTPDSLMMFGGNVHHCWVDEVSLPPDAPDSAMRIWNTVCSGMRKEVSLGQRISLQVGHTRPVAWIARGLARAARARRPQLSWRRVTRTHFRNQIGTLVIADGEAGVHIERVDGGWRKPRLVTVIEHKLV
ncbi:alkaline phosphatase D family protein [Mycolicibacterium duvalii]|uniref:DUF7800 domain-containing protein n=1 Tax=Mycolicibacterium duvalii TaxID=39688 RepID=UPI0013D7B892|nr:alkaline phosphatase D family protein [Mycolicibacterium duvalii]MCV7368432.1 alkaline phosphatase D family protein [Mycolicibacterium duvalii]